jgi:hypothetical protein
VEVSTNRQQHTRYTVGGFVRSPLHLKVSAPTFAGLGQKIDVHAVVGDVKGSLTGIKMHARVTQPAPYADLLHRYADKLDGVRMPDVVDGTPDKRRVAMTKLVLLRNQLLAEGGEDILASPVVGMPMSPGGRVATGGMGKLGLPHLRLAETNVPSFTRGPMILDPRFVARPRTPGLAVGTFYDTKLPGSYMMAITASGISPSCRSRFVRKDLVSVVVGDRKDS